MRWTPSLGLAAALVISLGIWAGINARARRTPHGESAVVVPAGQASPAESPFADDEAPPIPKIPEHLPQFSLHDLDGRFTPASQWKGRALVLNFWATWCGPCRREIPLLNSLAARWQSNGVQFVGVAVDYPDKVRQFATEFKILYPQLVGEQDALDVAAQLGMASPVFPFTVFADRNGEVVTLFVGELHQPQAELILAAVHELDQNRLPLDEARRQIADALHAMAARSL